MDKIGVIYKATSKINGKIYIGQSKNFKKRKLAHLGYARRNKDKLVFHVAIRKYGQENFEWKIIDETDINKLDSLEEHYINYYNSLCPNGYNMVKTAPKFFSGDKSHKSDTTLYNFYSIEHGLVTYTIKELCDKYNTKVHAVYYLTIGKYNSADNWVMECNKDNCNKLTEIYKFYHNDYGIVICKRHKLVKTYKIAKNVVNEICNKKRLTYKGWMLYETFINDPSLVEIYESSWGKTDRKIHSFYHKDYGIVKNTRIGLCGKYELNERCLARIVRGEQSQYNGWEIIS